MVTTDHLMKQLIQGTEISDFLVSICLQLLFKLTFKKLCVVLKTNAEHIALWL
jgi:hypothetical protein